MRPPADFRSGISRVDSGVRAAYYSLLGEYNRVLCEASKLGRDGGIDIEAIGEYVSPGLARRLLLAHVGRRLGELSDSYIQLAATYAGGEGAKEWLEEAGADARRIAASLPPLRLPPLAFLALVPPLIFKLTGLFGGNHGVIAAALGVFAATAVVVFLTVRDSYRCKREILLANASKVDRRPDAEQRLVHDQNVYAVENLAFEEIGRGKRPEGEVDRWMEGLIAVILAEVPVFLVIFGGESYLVPAVIMLAVALGCSFLLGRLRRERAWR